ncbi:hypothetical protein Taro_045575, partial [Colocasia esculenta]|nr:hypothetical protein [Colocasia esculenta]
VVLFECDWWDVYRKDRGFKIDKYGTISLNTRQRLNTDEPFALASQVEQVFYVNDNTTEGWIIPVKARPRYYYDLQDNTPENDIEPSDKAFQDNLIDVPTRGEIQDVDLCQESSVRVDDYIDIYMVSGSERSSRDGSRPHGGIGLYRSLSLPPLRRSLPLPHLRGSLPLPPLRCFLSLSDSSSDSSLFQPSGLFDSIYIFCSRSICTVCTILGEGHWPSRAD